MKGRNYPIILGHKYRKGIIGLKSGTQARILFCRLNRDIPTGQAIGLDDVKNIETEIWFTTKSSLDITIEMLCRLRDKWED